MVGGIFRAIGRGIAALMRLVFALCGILLIVGLLVSWNNQQRRGPSDEEQAQLWDAEQESTYEALAEREQQDRVAEWTASAENLVPRSPCDSNYGATSGGCVPDDRDYDCPELHAMGIGDIPILGQDWQRLDGRVDYQTGQWITPPDGVGCEWSGD